MQDKLVSNSGIAKRMPGRTQALPNALRPTSQKDRDTLIEQSSKYFIKAVSNHVNYI